MLLHSLFWCFLLLSFFCCSDCCIRIDINFGIGICYFVLNSGLCCFDFRSFVNYFLILLILIRAILQRGCICCDIIFELVDADVVLGQITIELIRDLCLNLHQFLIKLWIFFFSQGRSRQWRTCIVCVVA